MIGPNGEKRPGDAIANALHVAKIATGEAGEVYVDESKRPGGQKGGRARAAAMTPESAVSSPRFVGDELRVDALSYAA